MAEIAFNPDAIMTIFAVVEERQPEPSMGRDAFVWLVFESTNAQMMQAIRSKGLQGRIGTRFVVSQQRPDQSTQEYVAELLGPEVDQGASACIQCQDLQFAQGTGPNYATLVTVFQTAAGQEQILVVSEEPMAPHGARCFIANAAFGSGVEVEELRLFRDRFLSDSLVGSLFCRAYYRCSPPLASAIGRHAVLRKSTQFLLQPLVSFVRRVNRRVRRG